MSHAEKTRKMFHLHYTDMSFAIQTHSCQFNLATKLLLFLGNPLWCIYITFGICGSNFCNFNTFVVESTAKLMNYS